MPGINVPTDIPILPFPINIGHQPTSGARHGNGHTKESVKKISMTFASFSHFKRPFREALTGPVQPANEVRQNRKIGASAKEYTCKGKRIYMKRQSSIMLERQVTIGYFAKYPMVTFPKIQAFCNTLIFNILQDSR